MSGALMQSASVSVSVALAHTFTLTPGSQVVSAPSATVYTQVSASGYAAESYLLGFYNTAFGSVDDATYDDKNSISRVIDAAFELSLTWSSDPLGFILALNGTTPNESSVFHCIENAGSGQRLYRNQASYSTGEGNSYWSWPGLFDEPGATNTYYLYTA